MCGIAGAIDAFAHRARAWVSLNRRERPWCEEPFQKTLSLSGPSERCEDVAVS